MKKISILTLISFCSFFSIAQNLVPNPDFEDYTDCPMFLEDLDSAYPWFNITKSSDYLNSCVVSNTLVSVPYNLGGFQYAHSGQGYGGSVFFALDNIPNFDSREYLSTPLSSPLMKDSFYLVELFVNAANRNMAMCDCLEIWLVDSLPMNLPIANHLIEGSPQLHTPKNFFLKDTLNWTRLSWVYQAEGGEELMIIGNYKTDESTNHIVTDGVAGASYYYIDDVTVKKISPYYAQIDIGNDTIVCDSSWAKTLTVPPVYEYHLWSTGDTTMSITVDTPGVYWVEVGFEDCVLVDWITIEYLSPDTTAWESYIELCPSDLPYRLEAPLGMDSYLWSSGEDSSFIEVDESGVYYLEAVYTCGIWRDTIEVEVVFPEEINLGVDTILCNQPVLSEILSAPDSYDTYLWSTGETSSSIMIENPATCWVVADYLCGQVSDTIHIVNQPLLSIDLGNDTTFCEGDNILLSGGEGFQSYLWNTGGTESILEVDEYGTYTLKVNYACGELRDTVQIIPSPELWVSLPQDTIIGLGEILELIANTSIGDYTYTWQSNGALSCNECFTQNISPVQNTSYILTITDEYGCTATAEILVKVEERRGVYNPNAFSPNEDQENDIFTIYGGNEIAKIQSVQVYSRWGALVFENKNFEANDLSAGWNGVFNGEKMNPSVFVVVTKVLFKDGVEKVYASDLVLMK